MDEKWKNQEAEDDNLLAQIVNDHTGGLLSSLAGPGEIDQTDKADDAVDFEDIDLSDEDDLPDEEPATGGATDLPGLTDDGGTSNDTDDLFGDAHDSDPIDALHPGIPSSPHPLDADADDQIHLTLPGAESVDDLRNLNFDHDPVSAEANQDPNIPPPPENLIDTVKQIWPGFEEDVILNWNQLLRAKQATWIAKKPLKQPKPLVPSKLSLELDADQEKLFRISGQAQGTVWQKIRDAEARGLVYLEEPEPIEQADLKVFNLDDDSDSEVIGGHTLQDITTLCEDWDSVLHNADVVFNPVAPDTVNIPIKDEDEDADWDAMFLDEPPPKRRKVEIPRGLPEVTQFNAPNFDNYQEATAKLGKRVILDMNDPYLLIDDVESERAAKRRKVQHKMVRMANGRMGRELSQRFNFSNDVAYEALKENHSHRIRATLLSIAVDHSMPALRLVWPYYKVKLSPSDPYSYHRPSLTIKGPAHSVTRFAKPGHIKRKTLKGKPVREVFKETKDMSLNDNSTAVLVEYCEEIPMVLSNFGMGQKIVNYSRRVKGSDARPEKEKPEVGETTVLLPEDRSPFSIFGQVNAGEVVPTLHNQMFRAPVFKHKPRSTDFLMARSRTGRGGDEWYLRNIDHLFVVGQTLPLVEVPGPHSRKVTNIAKNRLKMVSYRLMRKSDHVTLHDITSHVAESNESQNRQKLKEFLKFRKDTKDWALQDGEEMMDESGIRSLIKPEEVCLLDAMQVGSHELEKGGYEVPKKDLDDLDGTEDQSSDTLANKMVPWKTTKNFLDASHGKAMLQVHGAGDPTGRGLGISFLRTSMKGGYLEQLHGPLATSADAIERQRKANGGHMYNVKAQDSLYWKSLHDIWERQRESLEDTREHEDTDVLAQEDEDDRFNVQNHVPATPAVGEGASHVSRSVASGVNNRKKLKVIRKTKNAAGEEQTVTEIVYDPLVIAHYTKKRFQRERDSIDIYNTKLTGDPERDRLIMDLVEKEQERLEKNKERRHKREKQKKLLQKTQGGPAGSGDEGSPERTTEKVGGTTRKCANCGQIGHIKTNKKLCPLLNGTIQRDQLPEENAGLGSLNAPMPASFLG